MRPEDVVVLREEAGRLTFLALLAAVIFAVGLPIALWVENPVVFAMLGAAALNAVSLGVIARGKRKLLREASVPPAAKLLR